MLVATGVGVSHLDRLDNHADGGDQALAQLILAGHQAIMRPSLLRHIMKYQHPARQGVFEIDI